MVNNRSDVKFRTSAFNRNKWKKFPPITCAVANKFPANIHRGPRAAQISVSDWFDRTA